MGAMPGENLLLHRVLWWLVKKTTCASVEQPCLVFVVGAALGITSQLWITTIKARKIMLGFRSGATAG